MGLPSRIARTVPGRSVVKAEAKAERTAEWHLKLVRKLPCAVTTTVPVDVHHLMRPEPGARGMALKVAGRWTIPLCRAVHMEITPKGDPEAYLMERYGLDARALAQALWSASPDLDAMERAVYRAWQDSRRRRSEGEK